MPRAVPARLSCPQALSARRRRYGAPLWAALRALDGEQDYVLEAGDGYSGGLAGASVDINAEHRFFSYEHFYVIFCKFCELDDDQDMELSIEDLLRYGEHGISSRAAMRIFESNRDPTSGGMGYRDFIYFMLSEEDKLSDTAVTYWFNVLDVDGDGVLSSKDMLYFYEEQSSRLAALGTEPTPFDDILCQLTDAVNPRRLADGRRGQIRLSDMRRCKLMNLVANTLVNAIKFVSSEGQDMMALKEAQATPELTDWDRWAALEYARINMEDDEDEMGSSELMAGMGFLDGGGGYGAGPGSGPTPKNQKTWGGANLGSSGARESPF